MYGEGVRVGLMVAEDLVDDPVCGGFEVQVLTVPGLYNSGPGHWQSLWEKEYGFARVEQEEWDSPRCADWIETLDEVIKAQSLPAVLVAHSLGCVAVAHWAKAHPETTARVQAAMLVAVSDAERPDFPPGVSGFAPIPRIHLPFRTIVVASINDGYTSWPRSEEFAEMWGASLVNAGECGHITTVDGFGLWPFGLALLHQLRVSG